MSYFYDSNGWLSDVEIPGRSTGIEPPEHGEKIVGEPYPNWTGVEWSMAIYSEPVAANAAENPSDWWIDIGPFYDRFGELQIPILASASATVQACIKSSSVRHYIDLKRADLSVMLDLIISEGFAINKSVILDTKPTEYERHKS